MVLFNIFIYFLYIILFNIFFIFNIFYIFFTNVKDYYLVFKLKKEYKKLKFK